MDSRISAHVSWQRLGRPARLGLSLTAAVVVAAVWTAVVPAAGAAATAARGKTSEHRLCSALFPTSKIQQITGLATTASKPIPTSGPPHGDSYWRSSPTGVTPVQGNLPGSICLWLDKDPPGPPWGSNFGLQNTAWVAVGYGETNRNWRKYRALTEANREFQFSIPSSYSSIKLGYGSQAFLGTVDLFAYYGIAPGTSTNGFPQYLYDLTVYTRHHNLLEVAFMTATLPQTEGLVDAILKTKF